jgi:hypothetical protein
MTQTQPIWISSRHWLRHCGVDMPRCPLSASATHVLNGSRRVGNSATGIALKTLNESKLRGSVAGGNDE